MKKLLVLIYFLIALCIGGCSDVACPIEVRAGIDMVETGSIEYGNYNAEHVNTVVIVALVDNVKVKAIKINKGNCTIRNFKPKTIKYGEEVSYIINCNNLLNAIVDTSMGSWEFNW